MTGGVLSAKNPTVPWRAGAGIDTAKDSPLELVRQYNLVLDEGTELVRYPAPHEVSRSRFPRNVSIEFTNALDLSVVGIPSGFISDNESRLRLTGSLNLVLDEGTELVRYPAPHEVSRSRFPRNVSIEFTNALDLSVVGIPSGFISDNESRLRLTGSLNPSWVETQLNRLFSVAQEEQFEAGMESRFSRSLQQLHARDPSAVLQSLRARLLSNNTGPEVLAEGLQWASRQEKPTLRGRIIDLLSTGLNNESPLVRDAAALGLAYLDEDTAIGYLKQAIEREPVPELHTDLESLIHSLETERSWR